ncbi:hypothetical protein EV663_1442 [Rhodovulum bhavnagarense]|uniref:Methyltransferase family protein n=1 Tax=Rhodovulum bhavnagarense TaxID=992286 RepID=A0A4V2SVJ5_9RHOB|nr:hypothetical protein [Rhodovulum bhavnagarense]TCP58326.1 hypothetical protein EV663_1442 [Rhodovulum bhavnagarense]
MTRTAEDDIRARFAAAPWKGITAEQMAPALRVPTMLSDVEQSLYFWAARDWARGCGAIVDLGCFVGGSTARLAEGRRQAGHGARVHGFDRFTASAGLKKRLFDPAGIPPFDGRDILPLARRLLDPWSPLISLHPGEIEDNGWPGGPIELLALDASKTTGAMDRMAAHFFPNLVPAGSLVIQQDYFHWRQPWIAVQMERLAEHFVPLAACAPSTMVFLCRTPPDAGALVRAACDRLSDAELIAGLEAARARLAPFGQDHRFEKLIAAARANPGQRVAWKLKPPAR